MLGFAFLYKDFPLEDFCFEFQYKARASKVRQTEGRREGGGTLSGVLTQQRAEQISSCIISSSICSCLQKGLSVGMWVWMGYQCCARAEQSRGGGDRGRCRCRCLATWLPSFSLKHFLYTKLNLYGPRQQPPFSLLPLFQTPPQLCSFSA